MKSFQVCMLSALLVICASNPIPQEAVSSTESQPVVPAVAASTEVPLQKALDNEKIDEKIPEPQALPSKPKEEQPAVAQEKSVQPEEKKREAPPAPAAAAPAEPTQSPAAESPKPSEQPKAEQPVAQPISQPEQNAGKSLAQVRF